jgi:transposase-like protein
VKLKEIAGIMGLADHTTAIRHVKSHEIIAKCDSHYAKIYNEIFSDIKTQIKTSDIMADKYALMKYCYEAGKNGNKSWAQIEKEFKMALNAI